MGARYHARVALIYAIETGVDAQKVHTPENIEVTFQDGEAMTGNSPLPTIHWLKPVAPKCAGPAWQVTG